MTFLVTDTQPLSGSSGGSTGDSDTTLTSGGGTQPVKRPTPSDRPVPPSTQPTGRKIAFNPPEDGGGKLFVDVDTSDDIPDGVKKVGSTGGGISVDFPDDGGVAATPNAPTLNGSNALGGALNALGGLFADGGGGGGGGGYSSTPILTEGGGSSGGSSGALVLIAIVGVLGVGGYYAWKHFHKAG